EYGWISDSDSSMRLTLRQMNDTSRPMANVRSLHERLLRHLNLSRITTLERLIILADSGRSFYSRTPVLSGRIIDRFYSREWKRITSDSIQLRGYLKKGVLLDEHINRTSL